MKQYNGESIRLMTELILTNNARIYNRMVEKKLRELVEAVQYIRTGREESFKWLVDNKHLAVAAFANAVRGDKNAFRWLMQNKSVFWAATANAVNGDAKAMAWLKQNNFVVYCELAEALIIYFKREEEGGDASGYYRAPV